MALPSEPEHRGSMLGHELPALFLVHDRDRSSGGGERVADRDSLVAAHESGLCGLGLAGQLEGLESWHELAEQRSELDAGELGAEGFQTALRLGGGSAVEVKRIVFRLPPREDA